MEFVTCKTEAERLLLLLLTRLDDVEATLLQRLPKPPSTKNVLDELKPPHVESPGIPECQEARYIRDRMATSSTPDGTNWVATGVLIQHSANLERLRSKGFIVRQENPSRRLFDVAWSMDATTPTQASFG